MRTLAVLVALALTALAPLAAAQGGLTASASPAAVEAPAGARALTHLVLFNGHDQPLHLRLGAFSPANDKLQYELTEVALAPGETREIRLVIHTDPDLVGERTIRMGAEDPARGVRATTEFLLRTTPPPDASNVAATRPPPLRITADGPAQMSAGGSTTIAFTIENLADHDARATLRAELPPGFVLGARPEPVLVPARSSAQATLEIIDERPRPEPMEVRLRAFLAEAPAVATHVPLRVQPRPAATDATLAPPAVAPPAADTPDPRPTEQDVGAAPIDAPAATTEAAQEGPLSGAIVAAGATATIGGAAAGLWAARRKWPWLFAALYTRLKPSRLLESPIRARLVTTVKAHPGITFSELQRRLDVGAGTLTHHAHMLERGGVLFSSPDGQQRRFYHVGGGYVAPKGSVAERALDLLAAGPRSSTDVARELGVSRQVLHYHVKKLVAQGKVVAHNDGRETMLSIAVAAV